MLKFLLFLSKNNSDLQNLCFWFDWVLLCIFVLVHVCVCVYFILWKIRSINKNQKRSHIRKDSPFSLTKLFEQLKFIEILLEIYMYQSTYQRQMINTLFCLHNTVLISHKGIPGKVRFISFIAKCLILRLIKIIISFWMAEWRWW